MRRISTVKPFNSKPNFRDIESALTNEINGYMAIKTWNEDEDVFCSIK